MKTIFSKTSSDGNCTVIESEKGNQLIIDCGLKLNDVNKSIGYSLYNATTILSTHFHGD